jgi:hypothetical protein
MSAKRYLSAKKRVLSPPNSLDSNNSRTDSPYQQQTAVTYDLPLQSSSKPSKRNAPLSYLKAFNAQKPLYHQKNL